MKLTVILILTILAGLCRSEIHSFDDDDDYSSNKRSKNSNLHAKSTNSIDEHDDGDELLSKKSAKNKDQCDSKSQKCASKKDKKPSLPDLPESLIQDATDFVRKTSEKLGPAGTPEKMMDATADYLVDTAKKYAKAFSEGKLDYSALLSTDWAKKIGSLLLHGNVPGGNPLAASATNLYQKISATFPKKNKKVSSLNLKPFIDEANQLVSEIAPGLIIALQHSDSKCHRPALCRAVRTASKSRLDISKASGIFLGNLVATYLDDVEKTKKSEYQKIVECCSVDDDGIYEKCSKKYMDEDSCSSHRLMNTKLLQSLDLSHLEKVATKYFPELSFLTKFLK